MSWLVTAVPVHRVPRRPRAARRRDRQRRVRRPVERVPCLRAGGRAVRRGDDPRRRPAGQHPPCARGDRASCTSPASSTPASRSSGPLHTYEQNVTGTATLLRAMAENGRHQGRVLVERRGLRHTRRRRRRRGHPEGTESPYGESKLIGEWLLRDMRSPPGSPPLAPLLHVVGSGEPDLYDASPHNLFPLVFEALLAAGAAHQRRRLRHPGRHLRPRLHPLADLAHSRTPSLAQKLERASSSSARLQPRQRGRR